MTLKERTLKFILTTAEWKLAAVALAVFALIMVVFMMYMPHPEPRFLETKHIGHGIFYVSTTGSENIGQAIAKFKVDMPICLITAMAVDTKPDGVWVNCEAPIDAE